MFMNFLMNFWLYLHEISMWVQVAVIAFCFVASYLASRFLEGVAKGPEGSRFGARSGPVQEYDRSTADSKISPSGPFATSSSRRRFPVDHSSPDTFAAESFSNLYFPIVLLVTLYVGKLILLIWDNDYLLSLLIPIVGSLALIRFGIYLSRRLFARSHRITGLHLLIERVFSTGVLVLVVFHYTGLLQDMLDFMDRHSIPIGHNQLTMLEIVKVLISVAVTVLLALWASAAWDKKLMNVDSLNSSLRIVLSRLGRSLLIVCAVIVSLNLVGIDLTVFSIFSGALGIGLGLGLQKIASSYVSGFVILFDRTVSVNDLITVDKYTGKVSKISTRYTVLQGLDGIESIIPNELLISSPVQNASLNAKGISIGTNLVVAYKTDVESLLPMLIEVVSSLEGVSNKSSPAVNLTSFGKNGLELSIFFWINNPADKGGMTSKVNRAIWKLLQERNIEVPYPQAKITVLHQDENDKKPT